MKNVSILGCGWLGLELGRELAKYDFQVKGSVTKPEKLDLLRSAGIHPYRLNWSDKDIPIEFFECDIMIITIPPSTPNYKNSFVEFIHKMELYHIKRVIYTSASSVYPDNNMAVKEEDAEHIISPHSGLALLEIENLLRTNRTFSTTILRFSGLYGPDRKPGKFLSGKKNISGGNKPVNLIHRDDCVSIIIEIIKQGVWGETFNASADIHPTRKEFYTAACLNQGLPLPSFNNETSNFKIVNSDKLKATLGYSFIHPDPMKDL